MQPVDKRARQHGAAVFNQITETFKRSQRTLRQKLSLQHFAKRSPERQACFECNALNSLHRRLAYAARGCVDDA